MKKLYNVTITHEIIVAAETEEQAKKEARLVLRDLEDPDIGAIPMVSLPADWEEDCIAYGNNKSDESDRTVGEWIALGAAPEYVALNEKLKAKAAKVTP